MDLSDDDFERPSRSSPRFKSKKSTRKNHVEDIVFDSGSENRATKKRKTARKNTMDAKAKQVMNTYSSFPMNYIFSANGCSFIILHLKQNIGFKCSPHLLFNLVKNLDPDQRKWVEEIGFGIFLSMPNCRLPKDLTVWLVNQCSWKNKSLVVRGRAIKIKPFIKKLLGIPDGPYDVPLPRNKRGKAKGATDEEKELKEEKGAWCLSYKSTLESLLATHDPEQLKRSFMLYVICIYPAPSSGHFVNLSYSPIVSNVEIIKDMNWCDHVDDVLIEGIREYRDSKAANVNVHGCVHVLLHIYIDVVKSAILKAPPGRSPCYISAIIQENGTCDFFLWDQHYAYFITGVGINLLIEATGGTSNCMFGMSGLIRDIKAAVMNTFVVCITILAILAYHVSQKSS